MGGIPHVSNPNEFLQRVRCTFTNVKEK
jgi:hypothetical protein